MGLLVGLTGGIASGKSTVSAMFAQRGAYIADADQIARDVVKTGMPALKQIADTFGPEVIGPDGELDRVRLGEWVFADASRRQQLNEIVHPHVRTTMREQTDTYMSANRTAIVIWDVPLLYEGGLHRQVESVIVVYVDAETQLARLIGRSGFSDEEARRRIAAQGSLEEKRHRADYVIDNRGSIEETEQQVEDIWNQLRAKCGSMA